MRVDGRPVTARKVPPRISNEQLSFTSTVSCGRATSHGSGRRSQLSGSSCCQPSWMDLFEDAVFVAQAITHGRDLHRGHGIEEASRQTPETAIAQTRVGLLFEQLEPIEVLLLDGFFRDGIEEKVRDIVGQRAADEKFHREIVNALGVLALIGLFGTHPSLRKNIAHGAGDGLKTLARADRRCFHDVVKDEVPLIKRIVVPVN